MTNLNRGWMMPALITKSLHSGPSPVILPRAQTACSQTLRCSDDSNIINIGTAPIKRDKCFKTNTVLLIIVTYRCTCMTNVTINSTTQY